MTRIVVVLIGILISSASLAETYTVKVLSKHEDEKMVFEPPFLKVEIGDTVVFEPTEPGHNSKSVLTPYGAKSWDGKLDNKIEVTLETEGVYLYECTPHKSTNMVGGIQVGSATNFKKAKEFAEQYPSFFSFNKSRFSDYISRVEQAEGAKDN